MADTKKLIPKRRFKGFNDNWERCKLSDLTEYKNGKGHEDKQSTSGKYELVNLNSISIDGGLKHSGKFIDDATNTLLKNDLVMVLSDVGHGDLLGRVALIPENDRFVLNQRVALLRPNSTVEPQFLFYNINAHQHYFKSQGAGMSQLNMSKGSVESFTSMIPGKDEQTKIGRHLENLDNLITLHQRKLEKIKSTKKAYLSEMFPAEGETKPKRRFKGFSGDWELCKVEELCSISTGKSNTQDKIAEGKYKFYVRSPIIERSNRYLYNQEAVLTVGDGVGTGKVFHYVNGKYDLHQRVYRMYDFNRVLGKYFYHNFSIKFYERVMSMTAKTSVDSVRLEMIAKMEMQFPSIEEQTKIVAFLENMDNFITLQQHKLDKLKNLKKAYLNEMFI